MDLMHPFAPVVIRDVRIVVDKVRPVAALISPERTRFVTWPEAVLPPLGTEVRLVQAPDAVWVIYTEISVVALGDHGRSSAVRVGPDGSVASLFLDRWEPIGADVVGLWCISEYVDPVVESLESERPEFEFPDIPEDAPVEEPEDLPRSIPVSISMLGEVTDEEEGEEEAHYPEPQLTSPVVLRRIRPDGHFDTVEVDRLVTQVESVDGQLVFTYQPAGPKIVPDRYGGAAYIYSTSTFRLPAHQALPANISVLDFASSPEEEWDPMGDWAPDSVLDADVTSLDLAEVVGSEWIPRAQEPAVIDQYTAATIEQLLALGEPSSIWLSVDETVHKVRSDYRELKVTLDGEWPHTEAIAEFRYHPRDDKAFRFRLPLFDGAGRPNVHEYVTIYLMEDLDTMEFADTDLAPDGLFEIGPQEN